jgi:hypothetical protein
VWDTTVAWPTLKWFGLDSPVTAASVRPVGVLGRLGVDAAVDDLREAEAGDRTGPGHLGRVRRVVGVGLTGGRVGERAPASALAAEDAVDEGGTLAAEEQCRDVPGGGRRPVDLRHRPHDAVVLAEGVEEAGEGDHLALGVGVELGEAVEPVVPATGFGRRAELGAGLHRREQRQERHGHHRGQQEFASGEAGKAPKSHDYLRSADSLRAVPCPR